MSHQKLYHFSSIYKETNADQVFYDSVNKIVFDSQLQNKVANPKP